MFTWPAGFLQRSNAAAFLSGSPQALGVQTHEGVTEVLPADRRPEQTLLRQDRGELLQGQNPMKVRASSISNLNI